MKRGMSLFRTVALVGFLILGSTTQAQVEGPDGHFYQVILEHGISWESARLKAAAAALNGLHGYLATVNSSEEDQFIASLRKSAGTNLHLWLGGSQHPDAGTPTEGWFWINAEGAIPGGNAQEGYSNWRPGQPDGSGRFLAISGTNTTAWESESDASRVHGFVVEYPGAGAENTISITSIDPIAVENGTQENALDFAIFEFRREGNLSLDLPVFFSIHGTAANGADYDEISKSIVIPAGEASVRLNIVPRLDALTVVERMETVGIRIEPSLILAPSAAYRINGSSREAGVVIYEGAPPVPGAIEMALPRNATYAEGEPIVLIAALSFSNLVSSVEFYAGDAHRRTSNYLGSATIPYMRTNDLAFYRFVWTNTVASTNYLTALTTNNGAVQFKSLPSLVNIAGAELPLVQIRSITPASSNAIPTSDYAFGSFEVSRSGTLAGDLQVRFAISGTATAGSDFEPLLNYVVIGSGRTSARITLPVIDDDIVEPTEFVTLSLIPATNLVTGRHFYRIDGTNNQASVPIYDRGTSPAPTNVIVSLETTQSHTTEPDWWISGIPEFGEFTFHRTGPTNEPLRVFVTFSGTATVGVDYVALTNYVDFEAGRSATRIKVIPIQDGVLDLRDETVVAELIPAAINNRQYGIDPENFQDRVVIIDSTRIQPTNVVVSIEATRSETSEPLPADTIPAELTVRRTGPTNDNLRVFLDYGGTAIQGEDYTTDGRVVVIPAGFREAKQTIIALADDLVEETESVVVEVATSFDYVIDTQNHVARFTIDDATIPNTNRTVVSLEATWLLTNEPIDGATPRAGHVTLRRTGPTNTILSVEVVFSGTATPGVDYLGATNAITFLAGQTEVRRLIEPYTDNLLEGEETVFVYLVDGSDYDVDPENNRGTITIYDAQAPRDTVVSIEATDAEASEANPELDPGQFVLRRTGPTNLSLTVPILFGGRAVHGVDYTANTNLAVFFPGHREVFPRFISALPDDLVEGDEELVVQMISNGFFVPDSEKRRATITIRDANAPTNVVVSIEATDAKASEPNPEVDAGSFVLRRTGPTNTTLNVPIIFGGTAIPGLDYTANTNAATFFPGHREVFPRFISPLSDNLVEGEETVIVGLIDTEDYTPDPGKNRATITIFDADAPTNVVVSVEATDSEASEPNPELDAGSFILRRTGPTNTTLSVPIIFGGTAIPGTDYTANTNVAIFFPGHREVFPRFISPLSDDLVEGEETVIIGLIETEHFIGDPTKNRATISIYDADSPTNVVVSFVQADLDASEPNPEPNAAQFTMRRTGPTNTTLTVPIFIGGTATPGVDYIGSTNAVTFLPGHREALPRIFSPLADDVVEGDETIVVEMIDTQFYTPDPAKRRLSITIRDEDESVSTNVVVRIVATRPETTEPGPNESSPGLFTVYRTGPTNAPLTVFLTYLGTATWGSDYYATNALLIPAGHRQQQIRVVPLADNLVEGDETVVAEFIVPFPTETPTYSIDLLTNRAVVTIRDQPATNNLPRVAILKPANGTTYLVGDMVDIVAEAAARVGSIVKLEVSFEGGPSSSTTDSRIEVALGGFEAGEHILRARATDSLGNISTSAPVNILFRHRDAVSFVQRNLPETYSPGVPFMVELRATPPEGANAYAVEDQPPTGWRVTEPSHGGTFDPINRKVKFGPFTDSTNRVLTYHVTPPTNSSGRLTFSGTGSINGALYPISGDDSVELVEQFHPADVDRGFSIILAEVTGYAAAWKAGDLWPSGPIPIPVSFVTSAGSIWKRGEHYRFDPARLPAPDCWVPISNSVASSVFAQAVGSAERIISAELRAGIATEVQIAALPPAGVASYALEEKPPRGWSISAISHEGVYDSESGIIRWGVFFDTSPRTFSYTLTPPAYVTSVGMFNGEFSFDGDLLEVQSGSILVSGKLPIQITKVTQGDNGLALVISGPPGQTAVIESTTDFKTWNEIESIFITAGGVTFTMPEPISGRTFYRLRVQ